MKNIILLFSRDRSPITLHAGRETHSQTYSYTTLHPPYIGTFATFPLSPDYSTRTHSIYKQGTWTLPHNTLLRLHRPPRKRRPSFWEQRGWFWRGLDASISHLGTSISCAIAHRGLHYTTAHSARHFRTRDKLTISTLFSNCWVGRFLGLTEAGAGRDGSFLEEPSCIKQQQ